MQTTLKSSEIEGVDLELTNRCNLRCPICLSRLPQFKSAFPKKDVDVDSLFALLDTFTGLELVSIAGDASEPTLHPRIFDILDYLKERNVEVELYTNASLHDDSWWTELNRHFNGNSTVFFTICGTTQELHAKYRVGSKLEDVIRHALAFRKGNPNGNDYMQYIRFDYNRDDPPGRIDSILDQFSRHGVLNTDPVAERFDLDAMMDKGICSTRLFSFMYRRKLIDVRAKRKRNIDCYSLRNRYVRIDPNLVVSPCICWRLYDDKSFLKPDGTMDYSSICGDRHDFCYECDSEMVAFLDRTNRDAFYMC